MPGSIEYAVNRTLREWEKPVLLDRRVTPLVVTKSLLETSLSLMPEASELKSYHWFLCQLSGGRENTRFTVEDYIREYHAIVPLSAPRYPVILLSFSRLEPQRFMGRFMRKELKIQTEVDRWRRKNISEKVESKEFPFTNETTAGDFLKHWYTFLDNQCPEVEIDPRVQRLLPHFDRLKR